MLDPSYFDLVVSYVQGNDHSFLACPRECGNMNLTNMSHSRHLNLKINQVQDNIDLTNKYSGVQVNLIILDPLYSD